MNSDSLYYLFGIFVGCLITQVAPFIRKFGAEFSEWSNAYTITFIISYVVALVSTVTLYGMNPLAMVGEDVFVKGFSLGLWNPVVVEISKHLMPNLFKPIEGD